MRKIETMTLDQKSQLLDGILADTQLPIGKSLDWYLKGQGEFFDSFRTWKLAAQLQFIAGKAEEKGVWSTKVIRLMSKLAEIATELDTAHQEGVADTYLDLFE